MFFLKPGIGDDVAALVLLLTKKLISEIEGSLPGIKSDDTEGLLSLAEKNLAYYS